MRDRLDLRHGHVFAAHRRAAVPSITAIEGSAGVVSRFSTAISLPFSSNSAKSVNVPPMSTPIRQVKVRASESRIEPRRARTAWTRSVRQPGNCAAAAPVHRGSIWSVTRIRPSGVARIIVSRSVGQSVSRSVGQSVSRSGVNGALRFLFATRPAVLTDDRRAANRALPRSGQSARDCVCPARTPCRPSRMTQWFSCKPA